MNKTMVTIDWDYFIPEKPEWDFGHQENKFFMTYLWNVRATTHIEDYQKLIKTTGEEVNFKKYLEQKFNIANAKLIITESHLDAFEIADEYNINKIYNYDSHCDLGYNGLEQLKEETHIDCGNWLGALINYNYINEANIIYSNHSNEYPENFDDITNEYNVNFLQKDFKSNNEDVEIIHICRSSSWCPPWLDSKFNEFIKSFNLPIEYNNTEEREWDEKEINRIRKEMLEQISQLKKETI